MSSESRGQNKYISKQTLGVQTLAESGRLKVVYPNSKILTSWEVQIVLIQMGLVVRSPILDCIVDFLGKNNHTSNTMAYFLKM